jgi:hypothetical protein
MSTRTRLIPYPEERALEDAAYARGTVPTRIFSLLLPVWCVEIQATVTDGEDYELIDRYLERGIAEAGLATAAELAAFFALDEVLVARALRFLTAIGHLTEGPGGRITLTELGHRSVRDQVRYVVTRQDRRKLYFDAFGSRPLTRPYYDSRTVTFLPADAIGPATTGWFRMLHSTRGFRHEALAELARNPERDHFNLPERIDSPQVLDAPEQVYLPLYVVRAVQRDGRASYLAYTQTGAEADADIGALCETTAEIAGLLETEERLARSGGEDDRVSEWLRKRDLDGRRPVRLADGTLRVTFPAAAFGADKALSLSKLGSYVVLGTGFFHVWCADEGVRRRALLARIDAYLAARVRAERADIEERIAQIARQLELGPIDVPQLRRMAAQAGNRGLAGELGRLTGSAAHG